MSAPATAGEAVSIDRFPTVAEFESGSLDPETFDHEAHVFIAWNLLNEGTVLDAVSRFSGALQRLTKALGIEGKYHETITWLYVILIAERKACGETQSWGEFSAENSDLVCSSRELLARYYSDDLLWSSLARQQFLLPDRLDIG